MEKWASVVLALFFVWLVTITVVFVFDRESPEELPFPSDVYGHRYACLQEFDNSNVCAVFIDGWVYGGTQNESNLQS